MNTEGFKTFKFDPSKEETNPLYYILNEDHGGYLRVWNDDHTEVESQILLSNVKSMNGVVFADHRSIVITASEGESECMFAFGIDEEGDPKMYSHCSPENKDFKERVLESFAHFSFADMAYLYISENFS